PALVGPCRLCPGRAGAESILAAYRQFSRGAVACLDALRVGLDGAGAALAAAWLAARGVSDCWLCAAVGGDWLVSAGAAHPAESPAGAGTQPTRAAGGGSGWCGGTVVCAFFLAAAGAGGSDAAN